MDATEEQLSALFPTPELSSGAPLRFPGWTPSSTQTVLGLLKDNHKKWHIFFNDLGYHNHASHHLLAIYAMGASSELLEAAYKTHVEYQRPSFKSPGSIEKSNWKEHLGDERYYSAYLAFFSSLIISGSPKETLEEYVFSKYANVVPGANGEQPHMLARYLGGFLHPAIHSGYGIEFGLPGLVAEGIAQAAVQQPDGKALFSSTLFESVGQPSATSVTGLAAKLAHMVVSSTAGPGTSTGLGPHALKILAAIVKDPSFAPDQVGLPVPEGEEESSFERVVRKCGARIAELASEWTVPATKEAIEKKFNEVIWANVLIYTVGGWAGREKGEDEKKQFNGDFFLMHLVTSALLINSTLHTLSPSVASLLLRTYFTISLVLYIARGRPPLPIADFYNSTTPTPNPPGTPPTPAPSTLPTASNPNPWLPIIQTTLVHPNEHLCKTQRALVHFDAPFGGMSTNGISELGTGLEGAGVLDGTLFIRSAGLTAGRLGWVREGEEQRGWDQNGFY